MKRVDQAKVLNHTKQWLVGVSYNRVPIHIATLFAASNNHPHSPQTKDPPGSWSRTGLGDCPNAGMRYLVLLVSVCSTGAAMAVGSAPPSGVSTMA